MRSTWKKIQGYKGKHELRAESLEQHLKCYTDAFGNAATLTNLLCKDIPAAIVDIKGKFTHLKDGYSSPIHYSWVEPLDEGNCYKVKSVRYNICTWSSITIMSLCCTLSVVSSV